MEGDLCASWENLRGADARHVLRRNTLGMRVCPVRHGSVLLSERPEGLSRHRILSGSRAAFPWLRHRKQELPILPGLCDHARGRPPRAEFAWHPTAGTAGAARYGHGREQSTPGSSRVAGRLPCRGVGAPRRGKVAVLPAWRGRSCHSDGIRPRRRSAAAAESRLCGARRFHPWLVRTTRALVHDRAAIGAGSKLQYLRGGTALTYDPPAPSSRSTKTSATRLSSRPHRASTPSLPPSCAAPSKSPLNKKRRRGNNAGRLGGAVVSLFVSSFRPHFLVHPFAGRNRVLRIDTDIQSLRRWVAKR